MRILIGGVSGFIGQHVRRLAESRGHEILAVTRKSRNPADLTWKSIERSGLPDGVDSIINLSGVNIMSPSRWTEEFKKSLIDSRVQTTRILVNAVIESESKPSSFIAISAIGYYGAEDKSEEVTEGSPAGNDFAARLCQQWEKAAVVDDDSIRHVTVRIGLALGRDGGMVSSMYWPFFFGMGGSIGNGKQWFPWVHVDDVAGILLHAVEEQSVSGVLNAVAPQAASNADFTKAFANQMWRFAPLCVPRFALSGLLGEERSQMMVSSPKISPARTLQSGYTYLYPDLSTACADCIKWGS